MNHWILVFALFTANGHTHINKLHGYDSKEACLSDGRQMAPAFDWIAYGCKLDPTYDKGYIGVRIKF